MTSAELGQAVTELAKVLTALQGSADQLIEEMEAVRVEASDARQVSRRARTYSALGACCAALVLVIASTGVFISRSNEAEQRGRDAQTAAVIEVIQACTSPGPGHDCYAENQGRSNQRLAPIVGVICAMADALKVPEDQSGGLCPRK